MLVSVAGGVARRVNRSGRYAKLQTKDVRATSQNARSDVVENTIEV